MTSHRHVALGFLGILMLGAVAEEAQCNTVCWTSFSGACNQYDGLTCTFKEHGYAYRDSVESGGPVLIPEDHDYEVTWTGADPEYPVRIAWHFMTDEDEDIFAPIPHRVQWDINITEPGAAGNFFFSPGLRFDDNFPNDHTNMTGHEAADYAASGVPGNDSSWNYLSISQPEKSEDDIRYSDPFTVQKAGVLAFLDEQKRKGRQETYDKWKLGVGIGVGLGVPILMAAAFAGGWFIGRRPKTGLKEEAAPDK